MKLHLPSGLRASLLTALAATVLPFQASAVSVAPARSAAAYELLYTADTQSAIFKNNDPQTGTFDFRNPVDGETSIDPNKTNWVLEVVATNVTPCETEKSQLGAAILTNSGFMASDGTDSLDFPPLTKGEYIAISPHGRVRIRTSSGVDETLGYVSRYWQYKGQPLNIKLTLAYDANAGQKKGDKNHYGGVIVGGVYIVDPVTGREIEEVSSIIKGYMIMEGFNFAPNFLSTNEPTEEYRISPGGFYALTGNDAKVQVTLYTQLKNEAAWVVRNQAGLLALREGQFADETSSFNVSSKALEETETVHFLGDYGTIYLESGEATYANPTVVEADVVTGSEAISIGFGAAEGATLTVDSSVLDGTMLADHGGVSCDLRIVGKGTVVLGLSEALTSKVLSFESVDKYSTVEFKADQDVNFTLVENAVGKYSSYARNEESQVGNMTVNLRKDNDPISKLQIKSLKNSMGDLNINGRMLLADGTEKVTDLYIDSISASGNLRLDGNAFVTASVTAGGDAVMDGNVTADSVSVGGGLKMLRAVGDTLKVAKNITAGGNMETSGTVVANNIVAGGVRFVANDNQANNITVNSISANSVSVESTVISAEGEPVVGKISITRPSAANEETPSLLLDGNVKMVRAGISANSIAGGTTIAIDSVVTGCVRASKIGDETAGVNLVVGETTVLTNAHSSGSSVVDAQSAVFKGAVVADNVVVPEDYTLQAASLASSGGVTAGGTSFSGATTIEKLAQLSSKSLTAESVTADDIVLADGYTVNKAVLNADSVSLGNNVILNKVTVNSSRFITQGTVSITDMKVNGGESFGGTDAKAFTVAPTLEAMGFTGTINGGNLDLSGISIHGTGLVFSDDAEVSSTYTLFTANGGRIDYKAVLGNYDVYLPAYVIIDELKVLDGNTLTLTGHKDEIGIQNALADNATRKSALAALKTATPAAENSALKGLTDYVGQVNRYTLERRQEVLTAIAGASTTALADSQRRGIQDVQKSLRNRIIQMGGGTNAGLTTDWKYAGVQAWAQADGAFTSSDSADGDPGYDFNTWGATVGANFDLTANTVVGMSFSASYGELDVDSPDHASGNNDAYYLNFYVRHQHERWVQMFIFTAGQNEIDLDRTVGSYTANGTTDGTSFSAYYEVGYTYGLNYEFTHILQPILSISLSSAKVDAYTETGSISDAALTYDGDSYIYGTIGIGARYQGVLYKTVHERNAVVEARALITQDFGDTTDEATVAVGDSETFKVHGTDTAGTGFEMGVGVSLPVEQHTTLYADADVTFRTDYTGVRANLGVRYDF